MFNLDDTSIAAQQGRCGDDLTHMTEDTPLLSLLYLQQGSLCSWFDFLCSFESISSVFL